MTSEVERLRLRVAELEKLLDVTEQPTPHIIQCLHRRRVWLMLRLLLARDRVSNTAVLLAIGGEDVTDHMAVMYAMHARVFLSEHGITLHRDRGVGWYLTRDDKARLRSLLDGAA